MAIYFQKKGFERYRFLSNFYLSPFHGVGVPQPAFATSEHAYQAMKATNDKDFYHVCSAATPREAKDRGAEIGLRGDWESDYHGRPLKLAIMAKVLQYKFMQHPDLARKLVETGDEELVEYAPWGDTYWGVDKSLQGQNWLGKLLMELREKLKRWGYGRPHGPEDEVQPT